MTKKISKTKYLLLTAILVSAVFVLVGCDEKVENKENVPVKETKKEGVEGYQEIEKLLVEKGEEYKIPEVDTTGWKTYENKEHNFSFQYPSDWEVIENNLDKSEIVALSSVDMKKHPISFSTLTEDELKKELEKDPGDFKEEESINSVLDFMNSFINILEKERKKEKEATSKIKYITIDSHQYLVHELWTMNIYLINSNNQILIMDVNMNGEELTNVSHGVMQTFHFTD